MDTPPIHWALKAQALLLESPFAGVDPDGEGPRRNLLEEWLRGHGVETVKAAVSAEPAVLEHARADAYDAMSLLRRANVEMPRVSALSPVHPLNAQPLSPAFSRDHSATAWDGFWQRFMKNTEGLDRIDNAGAYRRLFYAWSRAASDPGGNLALLPTDVARPDCPVWSHRRLAAALAGARGESGRAALLYLHVGPVQSFITAARRTHDLWMGSFMLSYLVLQAVKAIAEALGPDAVVYPEVASLPLSQKLIFGEVFNGDARADLLRASIANRVLAIVPDGGASSLAAAAMQAVHDAWKDMGERARAHLNDPANEALKKCGASGRTAWDGFESQMESHLEMDAIVQPWPENRPAAGALFDQFQVPRDPFAQWPEHASDQRGFAYGPLFDLTYRVLVSHRRTAELAPATAAAAAAPEGGNAAAADFRPKCTQCGLREQMGPRIGEPRKQHGCSRKFWSELATSAKDAALQLNPGEGLCAVCLTKRFAPAAYFGAGRENGAGLGIHWTGGEEGAHDDRALLRFPSTASIASAPFRQRLIKASPDGVKKWAGRLDAIHKLLSFTPPGNLLRGLGGIGRTGPALSYDGSWLYESSYEPKVAWGDHGFEPPAADDTEYLQFREQLPDALNAYQEARREAGSISPSTYYAVVKLDIDRLGYWLTGRHKGTPTIRQVLAGSYTELPESVAGPRPLFPALHGELSRRLARLAQALHSIVDRHLGRVVYSGGDDLLAFLPLATLLKCLGEIRQTFRSDDYLGDRVTISAGVSVAHWRDPLGTAIKAAREAEKAAKEAGRDRLAVRLLKRSGSALSVMLPWVVSAEPVCTAIDALVERGLPRYGAGDDEREDAGGDTAPLASPAVAFKLDDELRLLGGAPDVALREAFVHRLEILLGYKRKRDGKQLAPFPALLRDLPTNKARDVLLLARFLLRERLRETPEAGTAGSNAGAAGGNTP